MLVLLLTLLFPCILLLSKAKTWSRDVSWSLLAASSFQELARLPPSFLATRRRLLMSSSFKKKRAAAAPQSIEQAGRDEPPRCSVLDLPELTIDCILAKLPPAGLRSMAAVCRSMRERCRSDRLWEPHMQEKWGRVLGSAAGREWELYLASCSASKAPECVSGKHRRWLAALSCVCPVSWVRSRMDGGGGGGNGTGKLVSPVPDGSVMSWYLSLESGTFWLPAQVFNREHGHVGFMMSCYDAELSYDFRTDTFRARYPPHGRRTVVLEDGVQWDRVRAPLVDMPAHDLHVSDCLHDLWPGDHIEIQWRRNKEFPYGWWYGVVGHLESCHGNEHFCRCHLSDSVILEFNQYAPGSRWRQAVVNRKDHHEEGNEADGFYGGIRKLRNMDEISRWRQLWPADVLE